MLAFALQLVLEAAFCNCCFASVYRHAECVFTQGPVPAFASVYYCPASVLQVICFWQCAAAAQAQGSLWQSVMHSCVRMSQVSAVGFARDVCTPHTVPATACCTPCLMYVSNRCFVYIDGCACSLVMTTALCLWLYCMPHGLVLFVVCYSYVFPGASTSNLDVRG